MVEEYKKFLGQWVYRSLKNETDITKNFNDLEFGRGTITIDSIGEDYIAKAIFDMGNNNKLNFTGELTRRDNEINGIKLKGEGVDGTPTAGWRYDYQGFIIPKWSNGVDQLLVITGSVIRITDHEDAKSGYVGTFYMVKKNG